MKHVLVCWDYIIHHHNSLPIFEKYLILRDWFIRNQNDRYFVKSERLHCDGGSMHFEDKTLRCHSNGTLNVIRANNCICRNSLCNCPINFFRLFPMVNLFCSDIDKISYVAFHSKKTTDNPFDGWIYFWKHGSLQLFNLAIEDNIHHCFSSFSLQISC